MVLIVLIILILLCFGGAGWGLSGRGGEGFIAPGGIVGAILIVVLVVLLLRGGL